MPKPFMTYEQQMQRLKDKHLSIPAGTEKAVKEILRQEGYFALITGYKDLFKNPTTHQYQDGTTIEDILVVYRFDESLRELTLHYLLHIERHIRSVLSYAFCDAFGDDQEAYLDPRNYNHTRAQNGKEINRLIERYLKPLLDQRTKYPYIEHHKNNHGNVPLWILINALTFGTLSKLYSLSSPRVQSVVSKEFSGIQEKQLAQILDVLTDYRNLCAHNERIFSHRCAKKDIPDLAIHRKLELPKKGNTYLVGKRDYFAVVLAFRYLLSRQDFLQYHSQLTAVLKMIEPINQKITKEEILHRMGFPENWQQLKDEFQI